MKSHNIGIALSTVLAAVFLGAPMDSLGSDDQQSVQELKSFKSAYLQCAQIPNDTQRLACFDELPSAKPSQQTGAAQTYGGAKFRKKIKSEPELIDAKVVSCKKLVNNKWGFVFENGQLWKQTGSRDHRFKTCEFDVTLTKDRFGYLMRIDGMKRKVRVRRQK